ncbi:MAG: flagellar basal body protein, partial [Clostridia bacterium]
MSGLLGSLQSARSGMSVSQASIQTTSHNINNMNTPGYSRQRVEQSARSAYSYPGYNSTLGAGQLGTGVEATDVIRIRNSFYDFQYRNESHT